MKRKRIAIIGGGLAGLSAADAMLRQGGPIEVTVLESKRSTGGRAGSFVKPDGTSVDYCQHVAMGCCTRLIDLLERAELLRHWQRNQSLTFLHPDFKPSIFRPAKWLPPPLHLLPTILAMRYFSAGEKLRLVGGIASLLKSSQRLLVDQTAEEWLSVHGQSKRLIALFWEPILVSALGESVSRVSMGPARKTIVEGFAATRNASDVWIPQLPLSEMFGQRLTSWVESAGARVCTGTNVRSVGVVGDSLRLSTENDHFGEFDAVILAVPWFRIAALLGDGLEDSIESLDEITSIAGSPITGIHLWFDRPVLRIPHAVLLQTTAQWIFASPMNDGDPNYVQVVISAATDTSDRAELIKTVCREIRELNSSVTTVDVAKAELVDAKVVTDPRSVFSVTPRTERLRPATETGHARLFLAGDIVATGWPATMEGAVISGQLAAAAARSSFQS